MTIVVIRKSQSDSAVAIWSSARGCFHSVSEVRLVGAELFFEFAVGSLE